MKTYKSREEVPAHEKWNLEDIFATQTEWEEAYNSVNDQIGNLRAFNGEIHDAKSLYHYLVLNEEVGYLFKKVYVYAMLHVDIDTRKSTAQALLDRGKQLSVKLSSAKSFFMPFLLSLEEETLKNYIAEVSGLKYFEEDLFEAFRYKKHVLRKEQEEVLSQLGDALSTPSQTFGMINNADIKFGEVTNEAGEKVELTRGMYTKLIEDQNRDTRKEAYIAYYKPYVQLQNTIATTLAAAIKNNVTISKMRQYPSALEKSLFDDLVPKEVYDNLIQTTKAHLEPMRRYAELRKQILGLDELRAYDLNVPLVKDVKDEISFDEAYETMLTSLKPLGSDYVETLRSFKDKRYFDVRETPGKRSGAYNLGLYGVHPFILLNHRDDLDSLFTLVHESGHAMHSWYSSKHQPQISAGYSIFVAEVASTVNEILLIRHLLKMTEDPQMKKHLINHFIDGFKGTFFTQVMFAEFEQMTHEKAENGEPLNATVFSDIYEKIFTKYHGEELVLDNEVKYGWSRIPHFYRPFYVYKYATGYASAIYLADRILAGDQNTLKNYLQFLKSGSSDYPFELLKSTGVDLTKPEFIENALAIFAELVDEFDKM
ncbi:oligoendopeptidase F [Halalkalibacter nanhaiisediminis]|uniref:Oligopeptidase F n=1 Tax=Halalkalibacter nanhaiisediminis TaxID=688079 RepID=A0A562QR00_9BACI|nr:oligoendopeptidase F [Halalkalibacter nanhaiisediminis]TWI59135.1 oligoendopeptidase F [Halalkalibacter nanhaiisediminis]